MTEVSTPPTMLPPPPEAGTRAPRNWPGPVWGRIITVVLLLGLILGASLLIPSHVLGRVIPGHAQIDANLVAQKPGSARPTAQRVSIDATGVDQPEGAILFTTVALDTDISIFDWIEGEWNDDIVLRVEEEVLGDRSIDENRARNLEMMQVSKESAVLVALNHLGFDVVEETGVGFETVEEGGPVDGLVTNNDIIVSLNDSPITGVQSLLDALADAAPGDVGAITVENIETFEVRTETVEWGTHPETAGAYIGISSIRSRQEQLPLPVDINIDSGNIGGPSAGLAFTLTIIDLLTEGELTGGQNIAVTGTMRLDGVVGPVGGVAQKAAAAHDAGAAAFIVPMEVVDEAKTGARDMPVIGVETLQDALDALAALGGTTTDLELMIA